ncbi:MAG: hypothetical protein GX130_13200 [Candidatus Hydrogenedens sp.]|nr:hypothetical protein [Candidatus Hydrogenedens sp.]
MLSLFSSSNPQVSRTTAFKTRVSAFLLLLFLLSSFVPVFAVPSAASDSFDRERALCESAYRLNCFQQLHDNIDASKSEKSLWKDARILYLLAHISQQAGDIELAEQCWHLLVDNRNISMDIAFEAAQDAMRSYQSHAEVSLRERATYYLEKALHFAPQLRTQLPVEYPHIILDTYILYPEFKWAHVSSFQKKWREAIDHIEGAIERYPEVASKLSVEKLNKEKISRHKLFFMLAQACDQQIRLKEDSDTTVKLLKEKRRRALMEMIREDATKAPFWISGPVHIYLDSIDYTESDESILHTASVFATQNIFGSHLLRRIAYQHIVHHSSGKQDIQKGLFYKYCAVFKSIFAEKCLSLEDYHYFLVDGARLAADSGDDEIMNMIYRDTENLSLLPPEIKNEIRTLERRSFIAKHL